VNLEDYMIPCMSKKLFGIDCFGCGIQRALVLLLKGDFEGAFIMYPAIYGMLSFFIIIAINQIDKKRSYHYLIVFLGITTAITMVVSYFYKRIYY